VADGVGIGGLFFGFGRTPLLERGEERSWMMRVVEEAMMEAGGRQDWGNGGHSPKTAFRE